MTSVFMQTTVHTFRTQLLKSKAVWLWRELCVRNRNATVAVLGAETSRGCDLRLLRVRTLASERLEVLGHPVPGGGSCVHVVSRTVLGEMKCVCVSEHAPFCQVRDERHEQSGTNGPGNEEVPKSVFVLWSLTHKRWTVILCLVCVTCVAACHGVRSRGDAKR
jgi:hypothetical protein